MKAWYRGLFGGGAGLTLRESVSEIANFLLLTLLPNAELISIRYKHRENSRMASIINKISAINRDAAPFMRNRLSLAKLEEVHLNIISMSETQGDGGLLEAFMTLPSLRTIQVARLMDNFTISTRPDSPRQSNVTEIHCNYCSLSTTQIALLIHSVKCLRVFSYDNGRCYRNPKEEASPCAIVDVVSRHAFSSLTYLNCTTKAGPMLTKFRHAGSFKGFITLKTLRVSCILLFGDTSYNRLVDELPASLEELELEGKIGPSQAQELFDTSRSK